MKEGSEPPEWAGEEIPDDDVTGSAPGRGGVPPDELDYERLLAELGLPSEMTAEEVETALAHYEHWQRLNHPTESDPWIAARVNELKSDPETVLYRVRKDWLDQQRLLENPSSSQPPWWLRRLPR